MADTLLWRPITEYAMKLEDGTYSPIYYDWTDQKYSLVLRSYMQQKKMAALDVNDSLKLLFTIVDSYNKLDENRNSKNKIMMTKAYPDHFFDSDLQPEVLDTDRIVVARIAKRSPGSVNSQPFMRPKEMKPRLREDLTLRTDDNKLISVEIHGQWFDNIVTFDCCSPTQTGADELAEEFESFMDNNINMLMRSGVQRILYLGREEDYYSFNSSWAYRRLRYFFRTEKITVKVTSAIQKFDQTMIVLDGQIFLRPM
jgi:hypothetical protein